jgi:L-threonylcarbamoyladenylate synthase
VASPLADTRVVVVDSADPDPAALDLAAQIMRSGGLVAFATETVYGLGAVATQPEAVARIFTAKGRPSVNPLIVHVTGIEQAREYARDWPLPAERLASRYWPGPLTLVLHRAPLIPDLVTAGRATVGLRAPRGHVARGLIERVGQPIAAPSANRSNRISPTLAEHVLADLGGLIDLVIDSGPTAVGIESTVLDLTGRIPRVLRPGPISTRELEAALGGSRVLEGAEGASVGQPASPGQMPVHYAPRTPAYHVGSLEELAGLATHDYALIMIGDHDGAGKYQQVDLFRLESPEYACRALYDVLHRCDELAKEAIVVVLPADLPQWRAVRDRVIRASRPLVASVK